jgi:hypothetical protein
LGYTGGIFGKYMGYTGVILGVSDTWGIGTGSKNIHFCTFFVFLNSISISNLLTNASFRIGVPSILFFYKIGKNRKQKF